MQTYQMGNAFIDAAVAESGMDRTPAASYFIGETYAQCGEDRIVLALLNALVCGRRGNRLDSIVYLEVGANHPIRNSNTWLLYKSGACGYLVEANPELVPSLTAVRSRDRVINAAIVADNQEQVEIHLGRYDELSSLNPQHILSFGDFGGLGGIKRSMVVPALHINTLLVGLSPFPDFVSLDVEGLDLDLLAAMDFSRFRPALLQAEPSEHFSPGNTQRLIDLLKDRGYSLLARTEVNCIFADANVVMGPFMSGAAAKDTLTSTR